MIINRGLNDAERELLAKIETMRAKGMSWKQIADELGGREMSNVYVQYWRLKNRLEMANMPLPTIDIDLPSDLQQILERRRQGATWQEIKREFNISRQAVHDRLKRWVRKSERRSEPVAT